MSHGDLGAASCNATETIEHLDFTPPCDGRSAHDGPPGSHPAEFIVLTAPICECVPPVRLWCLRAIVVQRANISHGLTQCPNCGALGCGSKILHVEPLR